MKEGDRVICRTPDGYQLTKGKEYTVLKYTPRTLVSGWFTFPAYVLVEDDWGRTAECHDYRFEVIQ